MKVVFVCSGNVFRSAFAEGYALQVIADRGIPGMAVTSCGTIAEAAFRIPRVLVDVFKAHGVSVKDAAAHRPVRLSRERLAGAAAVLVMDRGHLDAVREVCPEYLRVTRLLKEYAGYTDDLEIPDPIGQPESVYLQTAETIRNCIDAVAERHWRSACRASSSQGVVP